MKLAICAVFFIASSASYAQNLSAAHVNDITKLAQAHEAGSINIRQGDALTKIAQAYGRLNNVPFKAALKGLILANPAALADAQNNLIVGAQFVLPVKEDVLKAAETGVFTITPVAEPAVVVEPVLPPPAPVTVVAEPPAVPVTPVANNITIPVWLWPLLGLLLAMLCVAGLFRAKKRKPVAQVVESSVSMDDVLYDDDLVENKEPDVVVSNERFNKALGGLSASSLDLTRPAPVAPPVLQEPPKLNAGFFNHNLKTPSQQWRGLGLNISTAAAVAATAKVKAMAAAHVPDDVLKVETAATPTLDVNVPQFLNAFSRNLPEPTFTSVDYEDLLDKARLQAWLNMHTPDQILLYAQDAHDARYDDVAQLMLNDVLLRGNAEQCAAVLNLRYLWSYPAGVY